MKYRIEYTRNGREIAVYRNAESAVEAMESLADQYGWNIKLHMYDADTRGKEWAEFGVYPYNDSSFRALVMHEERYTVVISSYSSLGREYGTDSRNAMRLAWEYGYREGGETVKVCTKSGKVLSAVQWSPEEGGRYYYTFSY